MTDRPAPRPPAASLTGPQRSPWLGQKEQGLEPSGVPERSVTPVTGKGAEVLLPDPPGTTTLYLSNFRPYPAQAAFPPRPILVY